MFGFLGSIGPWEIVLVLIIALIVFGPGKLPEMGKAVGRSLSEFKKASNDVKRQVQEVITVDEKSDTSD